MAKSCGRLQTKKADARCTDLSIDGLWDDLFVAAAHEAEQKLEQVDEVQIQAQRTHH